MGSTEYDNRDLAKSMAQRRADPDMNVSWNPACCTSLALNASKQHGISTTSRALITLSSRRLNRAAADSLAGAFAIARVRTRAYAPKVAKYPKPTQLDPEWPS